MSVTARLLSAEEFAALPGTRHQELVRGEVVATMPPGGVHGIVAALLATFLIHWNRQKSVGVIGVESGFLLARDPDIVRSPDAYFVRAERVPDGGVPEGFWPIAPDLAVEIISPSETADEVQQKVSEYLAAGTSAVWVIYPRLRRLIAHTPDGLARTYGPDDRFEHSELLPGLALQIGALFQ